MKSFFKIGFAGMTLIEVIVGILILAITALLVARMNYSIATADDITKKKSLATQVCMQLMDEMRHLGSEGRGEFTIDDQDDGDKLNPQLYIIGTSGPSSAGHKMLLRQINVFQVSGEERSRRVRVRVCDKRTTAVLAETIGFVRIYAEDGPAVQSIDTFRLSPMATGSSHSTIANFLNPNLVENLTVIEAEFDSQLRRDMGYRPKIMHNISGISPFTIEPTDRVYLIGRGIRTVDMFNHLERYPFEEDMFRARTNSWPGPAPQAPVPYRSLPPLRFLLNEMAVGNPDYRHSLIRNDGISLALPPMRNNSDAAKDPENHPGWRAVLHPENIHYTSGAEVRLRVYTYATQPDLVDVAETTQVTVHVRGNYTRGNFSLKRMLGNNTTEYEWVAATEGTDYTIDSSPFETLITLLDSPLRHPENFIPGQGISQAERLYGMEYIPCLVARERDFLDYQEDLADSDGLHANNTARWVINIQGGATPDGLLTVVTHLGGHVSAVTDTKPNLSTTYAWVGIDVPLTEQFQLLGDPRHMPYADVKNNRGYNRFFTRLDASDGYDHFPETADGWEYAVDYPVGTRVVQRLNFDFPRYMEIFRTALLNSNSSLHIGNSSRYEKNSTPLGYATLGSEFLGFDKFSNVPLKCPETAWVPNSTSRASVFEIAPSPSVPGVDHANARLVARTDNSWFCLPWLGELYPDDQYNFWRVNGNLPTGPGNFYRAPYSVFSSTFGYTEPKDFAFQVVGAGLATFVNGGENPTTNSVDNPFISPTNADFTPLWRVLEKAFLLFQGKITDKTSAPFRLDAPVDPLLPGLSGPRTRVELVSSFMERGRGSPSYVAGILRMVDPTNDNRSAMVLLSGNDHAVELYDGLSYPLNSMMSVWSFLEMGESSLPDAIQAQPLPRVSWIEPQPFALLDNPRTLELKWKTEWLRWDGEKYTESYRNGFVPLNPRITYTLLYSNDNRESWVDIYSGRPSVTGIRNWSQSLVSPYAWDISTLPEGRYVVRVEVFRDGSSQHFAYHERRIEILRP
jgi:hypothetical protein